MRCDYASVLTTGIVLREWTSKKVIFSRKCLKQQARSNPKYVTVQKSDQVEVE